MTEIEERLERKRASDLAAAKQRQMILDARKVLEPGEVKLHVIPIWLSKRITAYRRLNCLAPTSSRVWALQDAILEIARAAGLEPDFRWLDHWGVSDSGPYSCCHGKNKCFVAEPYGFSTRTALWLDAIADALDLTWHISSNTYWFPGSTIRIILHEKKHES